MSTWSTASYQTRSEAQKADTNFARRASSCGERGIATMFTPPSPSSEPSSEP